MALSSFIKEDRFSAATTRSLAAANAPEFDNSLLAPEYDHTLLAPEFRGENAAPEVDPGRGIQVFYDDHLPEAVEIKSSASSDVGSLPLNQTPYAPKSRKAMVLLILAAVLTVAGLSTGLSVGLGRREKNAGANLPFSPTIPNNARYAYSINYSVTSENSASTTTISVSVQPSATGRVTDRLSQHGMMSNTSLAAVTLPNGQRHVYFQETSGAIRRAISSSQVNIWQTSVDTQFRARARNNTPLALMTGFGGGRYDDNSVTLLFVHSANNTLGCATWILTEPRPCEIRLPDIVVSPDSRQISGHVLFAGEFKDKSADLRVLISYQDPAQKLVIMLGFRNRLKPDGVNDNFWTWKNETANFNSQFDTALYPQYHLANTCICSTGDKDTKTTFPATGSTTFVTQDSFSLTCFIKKDYQSISSHDGGVLGLTFYTNKTDPGQLLMPGSPGAGTVYVSTDGLTPMGSSDIALLPRAGVAWFNQSTLQIDGGGSPGTPLPRSQFPFPRIAGTTNNSTARVGITYLYHQLSDRILAQEVWDGTSGFWITNNITIDTTITAPYTSPTPLSFADQMKQEDLRNEQLRKEESKKPTPT